VTGAATVGVWSGGVDAAVVERIVDDTSSLGSLWRLIR
jgi:hypothetical protein